MEKITQYELGFCEDAQVHGGRSFDSFQRWRMAPMALSRLA